MDPKPTPRPQAPLSRRRLLGTAAGATLLAATAAEATVQTTDPAPAPPPVAKPPKPDPLKPELVKEFVLAAHRDLVKVQQMLGETPSLLNATWDWGGGDFESAMGAAAHTGGREMALYLLSKGARMDLFGAAMLGELELVKATLAAFPNLAESKGAHGIPLMVHAKQGGEKAKPVLAYLEALAGKPAG